MPASAGAAEDGSAHPIAAGARQRLAASPDGTRFTNDIGVAGSLSPGEEPRADGDDGSGAVPSVPTLRASAESGLPPGGPEPGSPRARPPRMR